MYKVKPFLSKQPYLVFGFTRVCQNTAFLFFAALILVITHKTFFRNTREVWKHNIHVFRLWRPVIFTFGKYVFCQNMFWDTHILCFWSICFWWPKNRIYYSIIWTGQNVFWPRHELRFLGARIMVKTQHMFFGLTRLVINIDFLYFDTNVLVKYLFPIRGGHWAGSNVCR